MISKLNEEGTLKTELVWADSYALMQIVSQVMSEK